MVNRLQPHVPEEVHLAATDARIDIDCASGWQSIEFMDVLVEEDVRREVGGYRLLYGPVLELPLLTDEELGLSSD